MKRPVRIANFSGAVGDFESGLHDAVHGDPADVLIGDYLAELTIGMVTRGFVKAGNPGGLGHFYFDLFLQQVTPELGAIAAKNLKVVTNAGALNPEGLAAKLRLRISEQGLDLKVAVVSGDNLLPRVHELSGEGQLAHLDTGRPLGNLSGRLLAANAYLGAWGIVEALHAGADIVITGRVTDASLTLGPAAWWHGWDNTEWDKLAGGIAAGHIIECGAQAVGGNYSGFREVAGKLRLGFPIAEIAADGSCKITKQSRSDGIVTRDTITAQLLYEIQGTQYLNPDVVLDIDSIRIEEVGKDCVALTGITGSPPPPTTKVACFYQDGWQLTMFAYLTGNDWQEKIDWTRRQMQSVVDALQLDDYVFDPLGQPRENPTSRGEATIAIRIAGAAQDVSELEKLSAGFGSFIIGGMPGFAAELGWSPVPRIEFWPGLVNQDELDHVVVSQDGAQRSISLPPVAEGPVNSGVAVPVKPNDASKFGPTRKAPLGEVLHARSGDKGGNVSLGVWCKDPAAVEWLSAYLTPDRVSQLMGLNADVRVDSFPLPNIDGQLFILAGQLGRSGTGNIAVDQMGKGIGEHLRACVADIPERYLQTSVLQN